MADLPHWSFGAECDRSNIVTLSRADGLQIPIHRELLPLVRQLIDLTEALGYDVRPGETWGYNCRDIPGTTVASFHSYGCAVDLNAPANPQASVAWHNRNADHATFGLRLVTDIPENVIKIWEDRGFRWGGRYHSSPDTMHFEFMQTVADARRYAAELQTFFSLPAPATPQEALAMGYTSAKLVPGIPPRADGRQAFAAVAADGKVTFFNGGRHQGDLSSMKLNRPVVELVFTPSGDGYWLAAGDGGIFAFGDAPLFTTGDGSFSAGGYALAGWIIGMQVLMTNGAPSGYVLLADDGGVFQYGSGNWIG